MINDLNASHKLNEDRLAVLKSDEQTMIAMTHENAELLKKNHSFNKEVRGITKSP